MKKLDYVNALIGTHNTSNFSHGNILPLVALPHALASWTIMTDSSHGNFFFDPTSNTFEGIRLTHQPSPWIGDYGHFLVMPQTGKLDTAPHMRKSSFNKQSFRMTPGELFIEEFKDNCDITLSPSQSGGIFTFNFKNKGLNRINLIGLDGKTDFIFNKALRSVTGYTTGVTHYCPYELKEYVYAEISCPCEDENIENCLSLKVSEQQVTLKIATSFISIEQAKLNFERELKTNNINDLKKNAENTWEKELSKIEIESDEKTMNTFYSCLYRALLFPRKFYETDSANRNLHINIETGELCEGVMYVDNGFWDTYRTVYPLLSVIDPALYAEMTEGFYNIYKETGWLPRWISPNEIGLMPGTLVEPVLADAIVKDIISPELAEKCFTAMIHNAEDDSPEAKYGRKKVSVYRKLGYLPNNLVHESVNETLDCCYGDFCIGAAAEKLGKKDLAEKYAKYAKNYANIFDKKSGFMRSMDENGNKSEEFIPHSWGGEYTEGSAWQASFAVPHDMKGLNELYGGKLEEKIDSLFAEPPIFNVGWYGSEIHEMSELAAQREFGQCAISNQPSFPIPYIYSELGNVAKTSYWVKRLITEAFDSGIDGFPGDEDNGTMASWYIFGCLGFYPFCPGRADFTTTVPVVKKAEINLPDGKKLIIDGSAFKAENMKNKVSYSDIMKGGALWDKVKK